MVDQSGRLDVAPDVECPAPLRATGRSGLTVAERLDRLPMTSAHWAIFGLCTLGLFADIGEVALSNALAAVFLAPPYSMPRGDLALLLASVFVGGIFGAPVFGAVGDRFGRRFTLQLTLAIIALGSLAAAASPDLATLTLARCITGFAIGGYPPLAATYLTDVLPPRRRGSLMLLCAGLAYLGAPAIIGVTRWLSPIAPLGIEAWRWSLALGGVVSALTAVLLARVPESPRWLAAVGRRAEAEAICGRLEAAAGYPTPSGPALPDIPERPARAGFRALAADPARMRRTALLVALYGLGPWATVGFPLLSAAVLVQKGFKVEESLLFAALTMLGPTLGNAAAALVIDRLERRLSLALCAVAMIVSGLVFAEGSTMVVLVSTGIAFNAAAATYNAVVAVYGAELLPTHLRASALTLGWSAGRLAAATAPLVLLPLLTDRGERAMFAVISVALVATLVLTFRGPRGRAGEPVS